MSHDDAERDREGPDKPLSTTQRSERPSGPHSWSPPGFLDAASGLPPSPVALAALAGAWQRAWASPTSLHPHGRSARHVLDLSRQSIAAHFGVRATEVSFHSSGSAALQTAVLGFAGAGPAGPRRAVASAVERAVVLASLDRLATNEFTTVEVPVDSLGRVDADEFIATAAKSDLACLQQANAEVGCLQPTAEVGAALRNDGVPLLIDATSAAGLIEPPAEFSLLAADARTWGGPGAVGILIRKPGLRWRSPMPVPDDTSGSGTSGYVPVPLIAAAATALEDAARWREAEMARLGDMIDALHARVATIDDVIVHRDDGPHVPHVLSLSALYVDGEALLIALARRGFEVHSGSACTSDTRRPSHVLMAMDTLTQGNVRISLPPGCESATLDSFATALADEITQLRHEAGVL